MVDYRTTINVLVPRICLFQKNKINALLNFFTLREINLHFIRVIQSIKFLFLV